MSLTGHWFAFCSSLPTIQLSSRSLCLVSRWGEASQKVLAEIGTDEHTFVLRDGTELKWKHVSLQRLLPFLCRRCPWFKQLLANVLRAHASPWHLITYNDDFTPGAALRIQNKRKGSIWEVSIGEFGAYLCHAELWFPIGIMRTKLVHKIPGKYSAITKVLLRRMWLHVDSLASVGVVLPIGNEDWMPTHRLGSTKY